MVTADKVTTKEPLGDAPKLTQFINNILLNKQTKFEGYLMVESQVRCLCFHQLMPYLLYMQITKKSVNGGLKGYSHDKMHF